MNIPSLQNYYTQYETSKTIYYVSLKKKLKPKL